MPRPSNRQERRAEIVDGLMQVLPAHGYGGATIARIARAAGLAPGLVHHHFENKQAILLALGERLVGIVDARRSSSKRSPRARLHDFIDAYLALEPAHPDAALHRRAIACWVALGAEALVQPEVGALYRSLVAARRAELLALLRAVAEDEGRRTRDLDAVAGVVLAAIEGAFQLGSAAPDVIPPGRAAPTLRRILDRLIDAS